MATVEYSLIGIWEILESSCTEDFEGIKFRLDELGELIWFDPVRNEIKDTDDKKKKISCSMSDSTISVLFCCETYEISNSFSKISFSTYSGQCIEFEAKTYLGDGVMTLTHDTGLFLKCQKTKDDQSIEQGLAYSLIYALKESNFSDITLKSIDNVTFHIHSSILRLNGFDSSQNYDFELSAISFASSFSPTRVPPSSPLTPLSVLWNLPSCILTSILHWLYSESLPPNMTEEICETLISMSSIPPLSKMLEPCRKYLNNIKFKKFLIEIIMDIHEIIDSVIEKIQPPGLSSISSPNILYHNFKQILSDIAVICSKLLQFCFVYVRDTSDFSRLQRNEIIKFIRSRLPICISQAHKVFQSIHNVLSQMTVEEKTELALYLVPEVKIAMLKITEVLQTLRDDLKSFETDEHSGSMPKNMNSLETTSFESSNRYGEKSSIFFLYMYELKKNCDIYGYVTTALEIIEHKRLLYNEMSCSDQKQTIQRNLESIIIEIPKILDRLSGSMDDKIGWKEFKFFFKFSTNQVGGIIYKLLEKRASLENFIHHMCTLIQSDFFADTMSELTFIESNNKVGKNNSQQSTLTKRNYKIIYDNYRLNLIQHLCESPPTANSYLAKNSLKLLHSGHLSDMVFEIVTNITDEQNNPSALSVNESEINLDEQKENVHIFRAHRVIVASRCEWFKKALISGMKEDINRKIIIHDTSPIIFRRLLLYLYGAPVDKSVNIEQICELMLLADRFSVDNLKEICETILITSIDKESVVYLLGIGDRFNALALKTSCLSYLTQNIAITKSEIFDELPSMLKTEVQELIHWYGRIPEPWNDNRTSYQSKSPSKNSKSNLKAKKSSSSLM